MSAPHGRWSRVGRRVGPIAIAGTVKWLLTLGLMAYLKAHGMKPIWGILIGVAAGAVIVAVALIPQDPPSAPPPPG